ncbi:MAG: InlB B-repeat-containing protein, partial [Oscillospiraceae bacterium]
FAADELPDVKLSIPTTFDKTVYLTNQKKELKITDSKTYLIKGSADPNWYFQYRIKIDGGRKKITPHIFLDGVRLQAPKDGPAIELYGGASACLYFIGNDSELIGAENFAALQKNKTDGHLRVLVQTGTKLTCEGGRYGAGIGGSKVGIKKFSQGHGMNLHFGSLATDIYGGEILATSGVYGAGIGGGQGGVGEQIYVYSGKLMVRSVSEGAGIGGGQGGPGRFIYIKGGTVNAGSESGGAGIGSGDQDGQNKSEDAHHIEISDGTVEAWSNYAGAGIGGGRDGSGYDISITGGVVRAQGYFGAGIGGGMNGNSGNILIKDTTLTALALPLYSSPDYTALSASAVGRGLNRVHYQVVMQDQEFAMSIEENIKIGASNGKSVWLSATGWQWRHNQEPKKYWYWDTTTELLIPNENGRVDLQRLSLPYAYNYGRVISKLELRCEESTCSHEFGWAIRDDCHIWACMKCGARDPAAEMSKQNGKHIPGDWSNQKQLCTVCDHVLERDTKAPVMETLTDGESYTVEDTLDGKPGAYTFTVIDPAASGETSSGVKSVTINGVEQDGPTYRLPAPDGGNNDAGAEYTVVATDNAGNETTATVRTYRRHHEHSYGDWSKDGTSHWHECADADCPNREESIKDKAAHVYTDDADTTCDVCGYERTVTPPAPTEFIVTFDGNGGTGSMEPVTVEEGSRYVLPACGFTAPDGQEFKAWEIGGIEYNAGDDYVVLGNTEIKALWKDPAVIPTTFTITFNANGGTGSMEPVTVEEGSRYPLPACGFTAPAGQEFKAWEIGGIEYNAGDGYVVLGNTEIKALWKDSAVIPTTFTITFNANGGTGSMEPVTVEEGSRYVLPACGFTAPDGQEFKAWEIGGIEYNAGDDYVVLGNTEIKALWKDSAVIPTTFTITFNANGGTGSMEPVTVEEGSRYPLPACGFIPPVNMQFSGWALSADGSVIADGAIMVTSNITLYAIWEPVPVNEFVVFFDGNGGTPAVSSMTTIGHRLAFLPGAFRSGSYRFDGWYTERNGGELIATSTVFAANTIVYAHWTYTGGSGGSGGYVPGYYIIRATAGAGGSITPSGDVSVRAGANQTFTITPNRGYAVSDVKIDGRSIGAVRSYTFENISASHTIEVQFRVRSSFVDVPSGSYYEDAVDWAVANGITTGTDAAHFSPDGICTRAQAVTFLWRAAGRPAPESRTMPFTDVPADSYYYDAVLWAVENGITKGTSSTTFSPDDTCTRTQIVTFLWRSEQSPAAGSSNPFTDVSADAYYADAVLWAVKEAITTGTTRTTFSPDAECTRAQIVTFLWRCKK